MKTNASDQQMNSAPARQPSALHGGLELARDGIAGLTQRIEEVHLAIAGKPHAVLRRLPVSREVAGLSAGLQQGITRGVYAAVRGITRLLFNTVTAIESAAGGDLGRHHPHVAAVASALNGAFGDHLQAENNGLVQQACFYHAGQPLPLNSHAIQAAHPQLTGRICVLLHGLACNESAWNLLAESQWQQEGVNYGHLLQQDHGYTPFFLRYNSGLRIADNGQFLNDLLEQLVDAYPMPVEELVLIGHSMGGLVARSACHQVADVRGEAQSTWARHLQQVVCIGSPHHGSPLERVAHWGTHALGQLDITAPVARSINLRSIGVKDLRYGYLDHADWLQDNPDAPQADGRQPYRRLEHVQYNFIYASVTAAEGSGLANTLGDGLVNVDSGAGRHPKPELAKTLEARTAFIGGLNHMQLLNHRKVYQQIQEWLEQMG